MTIPAQFHVTITNVAGALFDGNANSMSVPGSEGDMVILAHHEPLIAILRKGSITLRTDGGEVRDFSINSGVLEVSHNKAIVLI